MILLRKVGQPAELFVGAARAGSWDRNQIVRFRLEPNCITKGLQQQNAKR